MVNPLVETYLNETNKLDGSNFVNWKFKMQTLLEGYGVWTIAKGDEARPDVAAGAIAATIQDWDKRENKAKLKLDIQRTTLDLLLQLGRAPTDEEIRSKLGLKKERYNEVVRASKRVMSLNEYDRTTKEELINTIPDQENGNYSSIPPQTMLRLGLDDVLDSLKPKESLVIRQRFGLDGKGGKSLGEIAGNLNISREMVRKYEVKGLLKLKHPSRVEYLRSYLV